MIRYQCPSCQREYESTTALGGFTVICLTCKHPIQIPSLQASGSETGITARPEPKLPVADSKPSVPPPGLTQSYQPAKDHPIPAGAIAPGKGESPIGLPFFETPLEESSATAPRLDPALLRVATGLELCIISFYLYLGALGCLLAGVIFLLTRLTTLNSEAALAPFYVLVLAYGILGLIGATFGLIGRWLCLAVPDETRAGGFIFISVFCEVVWYLVQILSLIALIPALEALAPFARLIQTPVRPLQLFAGLFFLIFLKRLAEYLDQETLEQRAKNLILLGVGIILLLGLAYFLEGFGLAVLLGALLAILVWLLWYLSLLRDVRRNLREVPGRLEAAVPQRPF